MKTKQIRVPIQAAGVARQLAELYLARATDRLHETQWYRTAPKGSVSLRLDRIEPRCFASLIGPAEMRNVLVCIATDNVIGEEQEILLEI